MRSAQFRQEPKVRKPSAVFKQCPQCESPNVVAFEGDVICTYCGWDSIVLRAEARFSAKQFELAGASSSLGEKVWENFSSNFVPFAERSSPHFASACANEDGDDSSNFNIA